MNERWTRGVRHALFLLLASALSACAVGRLSDRIVIDAGTKVTGEKQEVDLLFTTELRETEVKLKPGDILTYTRWSPGFASVTDAASAQTHEPASDRFSLPLRLISPYGRLSLEEARFLGTVLTTHRQKWNPNQTEKLQRILEKNQIALWNALVENMFLASLSRRFPGPEDENESSTILVVSIRMQALCRALEASSANEAQFFAQSFIDPNAQGCPSESDRPKELTNPPELQLSPLYAAVSSGIKSNDPNFFFIFGPGSYAQFNFTEVERNGTRVDRRDGPESKWTLREWEESGICSIRGGGTPVIRRIRLKGGRRKIWIYRAEGDFMPTYHLKVRLTESTASRWIERISKEDTFEERAVLDQSELEILRMSDLDFVEWGAPHILKGHRRAAVDVRPTGCRFPNAS